MFQNQTERTAIAKARQFGWEIDGNTLPASRQGDPLKNARMSLEILGFHGSGGLWQDDAGDFAYVTRNGTVVFC